MKLSGEEDFGARNARVPDTLANFGFVAIRPGTRWLSVRQEGTHVIITDKNLRINVAVAALDGMLHSCTDLIGTGLPSTQSNGGNLAASVEGESLPV